jgi:hypothetical protein
LSSNYLSCTLKCPNFEISFKHSTLVVGHGGKKENTQGDYAHVEVEHELSNGMEHPFVMWNLGIRPFSQ